MGWELVYFLTNLTANSQNIWPNILGILLTGSGEFVPSMWWAFAKLSLEEYHLDKTGSFYLLNIYILHTSALFSPFVPLNPKWTLKQGLRFMSPAHLLTYPFDPL